MAHIYSQMSAKRLLPIGEPAVYFNQQVRCVKGFLNNPSILIEASGLLDIDKLVEYREPLDVWNKPRLPQRKSRNQLVY